MLYPKNDKPLTDDLFHNPTAEYRGTPFLSWNNQLEADELRWQIDHLQKMGMGGFHIHVRTGMATEYLSKAFMQLVQTCVDKARENKMLTWLYDEDRWPSGAAGGLVTKNPAFRARHLLFTAQPYSDEDQAISSGDSSARSGRTGNGRLLACYDILLDADGCLKQAKKIEPDEPASGRKWYAYLETALPSPWYNNQTYVDTLNPKAIADFIDKTHERYAEAVGDEFGKIIPAIFTDEPQFTHKTTLAHAHEEADLVMPWTDDLPHTFVETYKADLLEALPEVVWELPHGRISHMRYAYHDHIAQRFAEAFADQCGDWCRANNLMLTGHMMEEPTLASQTAALGEAMRSYRAFDLPGIDILCNYYEYTTAKQAQSAAHQFAYPGVLSELYGVTNWDFDFRGHKMQGDWQAALGITVRVHHLSWYTMAGEAKRDYPASIHYQSAWSERYPVIEDHFARVNTAMTRGKAISRVGVIHPIESFWLCWGPEDQTAAQRDKLDKQFEQLTEWLLFGQIDFDYVCESLLPEQCTEGGAPLQVGQMAYDLIVVPDVLSLRSSTLERLAAFQNAGGTLICLGDAPALIDGRPADDAKPVYEEAQKLAFNQVALLQALEPVREIDLHHAGGRRADHLLYQLRQDGDQRWLFIAQGRDPGAVDQPREFPLRIKLRGCWDVEYYNTMTGQSEPVAVEWSSDTTRLSWPLYQHDSLLFALRQPGSAAARTVPCTEQAAGDDKLAAIAGQSDVLAGKVAISLSEPNVLLLDLAEYRLDDGDWQPRDEILRADNAIREQLGWPKRMSNIAQPWTVADEPYQHKVSLRFSISCECPAAAPKLAMEDAEKAAVLLDGKAVDLNIDGWYVDKFIKTVQLPDLTAGNHILEIIWPFNQRSNLEWCYLLGDFSVDVKGAQSAIRPPVREVTFGNLTTQGLPFYGGAVTYHLPVEVQGGSIQVHVPYYRGALIDVSVDGKLAGPLVFSPYTLTIDNLADGEHELQLTLYASRVNSFGSVHNSVRKWSWFGPDAWRTSGDQWAYEYQLREIGILKAPVVQNIETLL